jgi:hypothetical protein
LLLAENLRVAHEVGALRGQDLKRVTVDTTVQPKAITFPTDAKLLHAAIKGLNRLAIRHGVRLRQSYSRVAKAAAMMAGRYRRDVARAGDTLSSLRKPGFAPGLQDLCAILRSAILWQLLESNAQEAHKKLQLVSAGTGGYSRVPKLHLVGH